MKSIKTTILVITITILFVSLSVVTAVFGVMSARSSTETVEKVLLKTTMEASRTVENKLDTYKTVIEDLGMMGRLSHTEVTAAGQLEMLNGNLKKYQFTNLGILSAEGVDLSGEDLSGNAFYQRAIEGDTYVGYPQLTPDGTGTTMVISAPIWENGLLGTKVTGVVYGVLDGKALSDYVAGIRVGETGVAYIINGEGTTIADPNYEYVLSEENSFQAVAEDESLSSLVAMEKLAVSGEASSDVARYENTTYYWSVAPIADTENWALGIYVEKNEFMAEVYQSILLCSLISLLFLLIAIVFVVLFAKKITEPIRSIEKTMDKIAGGNYDVDVTYTSNNEIGLMAQGIRKMLSITKLMIEDNARVLEHMAEGDFAVVPSLEYIGAFKRMETSMYTILSSLSEILRDIQHAADQVSSGAEQVAGGAQNLSYGAVEQAAAVEGLSETIAELSRKINVTAESAHDASRLSLEAGQGVVESNRYMQDVILAMKEIEAASQEIGKIIKSIEDIAFQTNILALNAAVEAARAGTTGKGFAVVADEVRNLASKSAEAANSTTVLIQRAIVAVNKGTDTVCATADALNAVVEKAGSVNVKIQEISESATEQANAIVQINSGVDQISGVVQGNSATSEESAAAAEELSHQAKRLKELCGRFQLKQEVPLPGVDESRLETAAKS